LVGSAVAPPGLRKKSVVEVAAIDQEAVLESAQSTERKIAVGRGGQAARVLRDARREQHEIGEAAAVQGEIGDGAFVEQSGDRAGLSIDELRRAGDGDFFLNAGDGEMEFEFGGGAEIDMKLWSDLRRHSRGDNAGEVIARREEVDGEPAFSIGDCRIADSGCGVDNYDGRAGDPQVVKINDRAMNGAGSGILGVGERECKKKRMQRRASEARGIGVPPVVGMRLGGLVPRGPEASGWETRFFCSMSRWGAAPADGVSFGTSAGVGILLY
jgi:hypothetical protein